MSDKWSVHRRIGILHCCRTVKPAPKIDKTRFPLHDDLSIFRKRSERGSLPSPLDAVASSVGGVNPWPP